VYENEDDDPIITDSVTKIAVYSLLMLIPPSLLAMMAVLGNFFISLVSSSRMTLPDVWHYLLWQLICWLSVLVLLLWPKGELIGSRTVKRVVLTPILGTNWKPSHIRVSTILAQEVEPPMHIPTKSHEQAVSEETQTSNSLIHDPTLGRDLQFINMIPEMVKDFTVKAQPEQHSQAVDGLNGTWTLLVDDAKGHPPLKQWKLEHTGNFDNLCIKLVGNMQGDAQTVFNSCMDETLRSEWDDMIDESSRLDLLSPLGHDRVLYVKTKAVFPTASRDLVLLAHTYASPHPNYPHITRYINVTRSIEHPAGPLRSGVVRIRAGVAGIMVEPLLDSDGNAVPNICRVMQLADTSLGGNIPGWLVKRVIGTVMPAVFRKLAICCERQCKLGSKTWDNFLNDVTSTFDQSRLDLLKQRDEDVTANATPTEVQSVQSVQVVQPLVKQDVDPVKILELQFRTLDTRMRVLELTATAAKKQDWSGLVSVAASVFIVGWHVGTRLKGFRE
jgi:hypothetical protein